MRNFPIPIVSVVKICKQCLQTVPASRGFVSQTPYRGFAPGPHWGSPRPLGYSPKRRRQWCEKVVFSFHKLCPLSNKNLATNMVAITTLLLLRLAPATWRQELRLATSNGNLSLPSIFS